MRKGFLFFWDAGLATKMSLEVARSFFSNDPSRLLQTRDFMMMDAA
jgi:hypothetical protein